MSLHGRAPGHTTERETESVTLTITTCKRFDLFEVTMDSFLRCCTDADRIRRWICVDDGSEPRDRERMRERYPFEYVWKGPDERGHARSLNLLRDKVGERPTEFVLHLEDDWEFTTRRPYVADAIAILRNDDRLGQVVFNPNYVESPEEPFVGGYPVPASPGRHPAYIVHEHHPMYTEAYDEFVRRTGGRHNQAYWPHYSLQPSLLRFGVWRSLGRWDERVPAARFEWEYAERYRDEGWQTAFFPVACTRHIGRLRSEWNNPAKRNAYQLNERAARRLRGPGPRV